MGKGDDEARKKSEGPQIPESTGLAKEDASGAKGPRGRIGPLIIITGVVVLILILMQAVWILKELRSKQSSYYGPKSATPVPAATGISFITPGGQYDGKGFPGKASPPRIPPEGPANPPAQPQPLDGARMGAWLIDTRTPVGLYFLADSKDPALRLTKEQARRICNAIERSLLSGSIRLLIDAELISIFTRPQLEAIAGKFPDNTAPKPGEVKAALESLKKRLGKQTPGKLTISSLPPQPPEKGLIFPALTQVVRAVPTMTLETDQMVRLYSLLVLVHKYVTFEGPFGDLSGVLKPAQLAFLRNVTEDAYRAESVPFPEGDKDRCGQLFLFELRDRLKEKYSL